MTPAKKTRVSSSWHSTFEAAYRESRFRKAAEIFASNAGPSEGIDLVLQAAQANMHADPAVALRLLLKSAVPPRKREARILRDSLLVETFARTNDFESADAHLERALAAARELGDPDLLATAGYRGVRRYLLAYNPKDAREYLELARQGPSPRARIYAAYSETMILGFEERLAEQAQRLAEFLRLLDANAPEYASLRAWSTHTLAALARELYVPTAIPEIERHIAGAPWPEDFSANLFQALRGLAWAKALQGDYFNAFRHLKRASDVADTRAWKVFAACDRAQLARSFGEHRWSRVELDEAEQLAASVDWHATLAEERMALLSLAELFADLDTTRSAMYLARYRELGHIRSPLYNPQDSRRDAYGRYYTGVVEIALGNKKRGLTELREARKVFERLSYDFRAASCLVSELHATGDRALIPSIHEKLRNYPHSSLTRELQSEDLTPRVQLPPMQCRVFEGICQGKSTAEIARALDRSEYTINNHLKMIYKTFEVRSRSALIAEALRRGLIKPP